MLIQGELIWIHDDGQVACLQFPSIGLESISPSSYTRSVVCLLFLVCLLLLFIEAPFLMSHFQIKLMEFESKSYYNPASSVPSTLK